jgi:predicted ATP-grasp superfamily ATP-dependent carboligase
VDSFPAPSPTREAPEFAREVLAKARAGDRGAVLPCSEAAVLALQTRREEIEAVAEVLLPAAPILERALDKRLTLEAAGRCGVAVPRTFVAEDARAAEACPIPFPVVVKPCRSRWITSGGNVAGTGPSFAADAAGLRACLDRIADLGCPASLVQEWVPGTGFGVSVLMRGGSPAALFLHRRIREVHPAGGPSSAAESAAADPALVDPALALLRALEWEGLAMVEFRRDGTAAPVLMEVNGRPWGTIGLAVDAGVDFPRLLVEGHAGPPPEYRAGLRRRWLAGDARRLGAAIGGSPAAYPGRFPSVGEALGDILVRGAPDFVFRWSDPGPFLGEILGAFA